MAREVLDMVISISRLKSGDYDFVRQDMAARRAGHAGRQP